MKIINGVKQNGINTGDIDGVAIDDCIIGGDTPAAGSFTVVSIGGVLRFSQTPQVLTGSGAVDITSAVTHIVTAGVGDALTLADGGEGQIKTILMKTLTTAGDSSILTPDNYTDPHGSTVTFDANGDVLELLFSGGSWYWTGGRGN